MGPGKARAALGMVGNQTGKQRGQGHYKDRSPKAPTLEDGTGILLVFGLLKPRKSFSERHILLDGASGTPFKLLRPFYELYKSLGLDSFRF
jgi:hypothetical protein